MEFKRREIILKLFLLVLEHVQYISSSFLVFNAMKYVKKGIQIKFISLFLDEALFTR